jgi:hypothetical protein
MRRRRTSCIPDCRDSPQARQLDMTPTWLVRLNDFLAWLNPVLGLIAGVLAAMVIAAATERLPVPPSRPAAPAAQAVRPLAQAACQKAALPPEWRELSLYD